MIKTNEEVLKDFFTKFPGVHDVRSWGCQDCACDDGKEDCGELIQEFISQALNERTKAIREMVENVAKRVGNTHYDGNSIRTAEDYYGISAEDWSEVIRLEEGHKMATRSILESIDSLLPAPNKNE